MKISSLSFVLLLLLITYNIDESEAFFSVIYGLGKTIVKWTKSGIKVANNIKKAQLEKEDRERMKQIQYEVDVLSTELFSMSKEMKNQFTQVQNTQQKILTNLGELEENQKIILHNITSLSAIQQLAPLLTNWIGLSVDVDLKMHLLFDDMKRNLTKNELESIAKSVLDSREESINSFVQKMHTLLFKMNDGQLFDHIIQLVLFEAARNGTEKETALYDCYQGFMAIEIKTLVSIRFQFSILSFIQSNHQAREDSEIEMMNLRVASVKDHFKKLMMVEYQNRKEEISTVSPPSSSSFTGYEDKYIQVCVEEVKADIKNGYVVTNFMFEMHENYYRIKIEESKLNDKLFVDERTSRWRLGDNDCTGTITYGLNYGLYDVKKENNGTKTYLLTGLLASHYFGFGAIYDSIDLVNLNSTGEVAIEKFDKLASPFNDNLLAATSNKLLLSGFTVAVIPTNTFTYHKKLFNYIDLI